MAQRIESGERLSVAEVKETKTKAKADAPSLIPDKPNRARHKPSYIPDNVIDDIVVRFKGLAQNDQHRCVGRLSRILRGETS